jgi:7-cyano-7-deazaguanine synthase
MREALVLLSGGMDSATALALSLRNYGNRSDAVEAVSFNYGQRHARELEAAESIAAHYKVRHTILDLRGASLAFEGSALTGKGEVPEGHYQDASMKKTVVPNRNMIMLSLAVGLAISREMNSVVYGAHAGDHEIYPDCRPDFLVALQVAVSLGNYRPLSILAPFIDKSKMEIARMGFDVNVPFDMTWSCYKGQDIHCGVCGTCVERREAFELAKVPDPTFYDGDYQIDILDEQNRGYNLDIANSLRRHNQ